MSDYTLTFLLMEIGFVISVTYLAFHMTMSIGTAKQIKHFRLIQAFIVLQCLAQVFWILHESSIVQYPIWFTWIVDITYAMAFGFCMYEWFQFIHTKVEKLLTESFRNKIEFSQRCVLVIQILLNLTTIFTKWIFYVDVNGNYVRGPLFWVNSVICFSYWIVSIVIMCIAMKNTDKAQQQRIQRLIRISLIPVCGGVLQMFFYNIPFADATMTIAVLCLFVFLQESQIRTDALTGLNNRAQFEYAYGQKLSKANTEPFYILIADIDKFKNINDTYGHLVGDQALIIIANGLKAIGQEHPSLGIYRYGGDEFVLLIGQKALKDVDGFCEKINEAIKKETQKQNIDYDLRFSVGYQLVDDPNEEQKAFESADNMLMRKKKAIINCMMTSTDIYL